MLQPAKTFIVWATRSGILLSLTVTFASAAVDLNGNGMSDVWEQYFHAQGISPSADSDGDGVSNLAESIAGTNPFDTKSTLRASKVVVGGGMVTVSWFSVANKSYQVQSNAGLAATNWQNLGTPLVGNGQEMSATFGIPVGQNFFRVSVGDLDSDHDGVTDWEEMTAGLSPLTPHTAGAANDDLTTLKAALQATTSTITVNATVPYTTRLSASPGVFTFARTGKLDAVTVNYAIGGTAGAGTDYNPVTGSVNLPFGLNSAATVTIIPKPGAAPSTTARTIVFTTSPNANYMVGTPTSDTVTIGAEAGSNSVLQEVWSNLSGYGGVADIPVTTPPTTSRVLTTLEGPQNAGSNYGTRVRGYIIPPTTGNYRFWIASDDSSEYWLSTDDQSANLVKRAYVTTYTGSRQWAKEANQKSPLLALTAGQKYYFEALQRQYGGGDNLAVGWFKPGDPGTGAIPSEVVPASALAPYMPPITVAGTTTLSFATLQPQAGVSSSASGTASLRLSSDETFAILSLNYGNLSSPLTGAHVHGPADPSQNGGILFDIDAATPQSDGTFLWTFTQVGANSVADIVNAIRSGRTYVNVHTSNYPAGEIRGQFGLSVGTSNFTPPPDPPALVDDHTDANAAARFLTQATFGPNAETIAQLQRDGYASFLDQQFAAPISFHLPYVDAYEAANPGMTSNDQTMEAWWNQAITAPDQLRQRVAFALSELFVVSDQSGELQNQPVGLSGYVDLLLNNAFGNFRTLLEQVTLSPTMGVYLNMLQNDKPNPTAGTQPNENYAREIQQLFTIGLNKLNPDGTLLLDSQNRPIPTYDQSVVVGFAHVFTGWYFTPADGNANWDYESSNYRAPMLAFPEHHDTAQKRLLDNVVLPANQSQAQDLKDALDLLFNHPNVGPFICRQLIQRLVTSNPSPAYVYRVAKVFTNNGQGVRGDLKAVVRAILLDYEARNQTSPTTSSFGHEREPVIRLANLQRAFHASASNGVYGLYYLTDWLGQNPLDSPTVFNFFEPGYTQPGQIASAGLVAPEFQITTDTTVVNSINFLGWQIYQDPDPMYPGNIVLNWTPSQLSLANNPAALADYLNTLLLNGQMPDAMRTQLINSISAISVDSLNPNPDLLYRARAATYLIIASPQFNIER